MAKKFTFDDAITTDIKGAASNSYIDKLCGVFSRRTIVCATGSTT